MSDWQPKEHTADPMVNAVLNVAEQLAELAEATRGLLYGLKYGKAEGMSIAEAIEVAGNKIADLFPGDDVTSALIEIAEAVEGVKDAVKP